MIESPLFTPINLENLETEKFQDKLHLLGVEQLTITSRNSQKIGDSNVKIILCLAGFTETGEATFGSMADKLATDPNIAVLLFSTPGSSESTFTTDALKNEQTFGALDYAQLTKLYLERIGVIPDLIIGHSFGAVAATQIDSPNKVLLAPAFKLTEGFKLVINQLIKKKEKGEVLDDNYVAFLTTILGQLPADFVENINAIPVEAVQKVFNGLLETQPVAFNPEDQIVSYYSKGEQREQQKMGRSRTITVGDEKVIDALAIPLGIKTTQLTQGGHNAHLISENEILICEEATGMLRRNTL